MDPSYHKNITINCSPCPNDLFIFSAWAKQLFVPPNPITCNLVFSPIHDLNNSAKASTFAVAKVSVATALQLHQKYWLLPVGAAVGRGFGPLIVSRSQHQIFERSCQAKIYIPGQETMAALVFKKLYPQFTNFIERPFHQIISETKNDPDSLGLIIHESRFALKEHDLKILGDLGKQWEKKWDLPLPLGCLIARKDIEPAVISEMIVIIRKSIAYAMEFKDHVWPFVLKHSQESNLDSVRKHVELYVNNDTLELSPEAKKAIMAFASGSLTEDELFFPNE